jgi:hypothetical protein
MIEDLDFSGTPGAARPSKTAGLLTQRGLRRNGDRHARCRRVGYSPASPAALEDIQKFFAVELEFHFPDAVYASHLL